MIEYRCHIHTYHTNWNILGVYLQRLHAQAEREMVAKMWIMLPEQT